MKSSVPSRRRARSTHNNEAGYVLITLLLFVAVLAIGMAAMAPVVSQQVKRDREEELIHRAVQYPRAIKRYVKKFGRYPTRLEDLENTNNIRCLRRRYKDPITGKDFKILHLGEVQVSGTPGIQGAIPAGNLAAGALAAGNQLGGNAGGFGSSGGFGNNGSFGNNSGFGNSAFGGQGSFGNNSSGGMFGGNTAGGNSFGGNTSGGNTGSSSFSLDFGSGSSTGSNPSQGSSSSSDNSQSGSNNPSAPGNNSNQQATGANQVFGGGPIVGVASLSKDKTIRVFNKKDSYNKWQFVYDPNSDRGGLLTMPGDLSAQGFGTPVQNLGGANQQNGPFGSQPTGGFPGGQSNSPGGGQLTPQPSPYPPMPPEQGPQPQ